MYIRPIMVTLDKSQITGALADGVYSSVISLNIGHLIRGATRDYCVKQITVATEDPNIATIDSWSVAFLNDSGGGDSSDLDSDAVAAIEAVTPNTLTSPVSGMRHYSNSDLEIYIKGTPTGSTTDTGRNVNTEAMQMHVQIAPSGAAKTTGATGEVVVKFWVVPIMGV